MTLRLLYCICLPKSYRWWYALRSWLSGHLQQPSRTTLIDPIITAKYKFLSLSAKSTCIDVLCEGINNVLQFCCFLGGNHTRSWICEYANHKNWYQFDEIHHLNMVSLLHFQLLKNHMEITLVNRTVKKKLFKVVDSTKHCWELTLVICLFTFWDFN